MYLFQRLPHNLHSINLLFTFHYVSISTLRHISQLLSSVIFTFHYVSISTSCHMQVRMLCSNLHSTMYLFQRASTLRESISFDIYIPLCIYFNLFVLNTHFIYFIIYIPLCIYFNEEVMQYLTRVMRFTFHYVSIST